MSTAPAALAARGLRVAVVERELVGGECSYWACIPSKSLLRPGEAVQGARDVGASAQVDVQAALAWRDFMVSNYSDAGQERWLAEPGHRPAARHGPARRHRRGRSRRRPPHRGARRRGDRLGRRSCRPSPGLRELEGVWGTREATSMKAVPRRLLVLGGGAAGVELAQVVRRLGGEAVIIEGADRVLPREPAPLGEALGEALRRDGIELVLGTHATAARREGTSTSWSSTDGRRCGATGCWWPPAGARASRGSAWRRSASTADPHGIPVDEHLRAGERLWAIGDVNGIWPLTHVGEYEGDVVAANIAGERAPGELRSRSAGHLHRSAGRGGGRGRSGVQRHRAAVGGAEDGHLHPRLRRNPTGS